MEFKNKDNVEIIVKILKSNHIKDLVISPGGTSIPIVEVVQDDPFFHCYSVVDERSASYVALGISIQRNKPVALICTSAQATRNYIPGLTEAFYKNIPILAITMEKHPRFKYQGYMQAPDQTSLPNDCVKESFELPFISDINDYYHSCRLVNEAILELTRNSQGPVQLCVPWLDFPLTNKKTDIKMIERFDISEVEKVTLSGKKVLLIIGEHTPFNNEEYKTINEFCHKTNAVIYCNHLSNFNNEYTINGNLILLTSNLNEIKEIIPDIIITIGGQTGDYPLYLALSKNIFNNIEHWSISKDGRVVDTYDKLTRIYQGNLLDFFSKVDSTCEKHTYYHLWKEKGLLKNNNIIVPFSQVSIAQYLHNKIPNNSIIQFSILNSLRIWSLFKLDPSIECYSNVGAFGIDGGMSTLIGQSIVSNKLSFMIIGDLAFFYDINSLSIRDIKNNVRILLVNNNGGIEFKLHGEDKKSRDKFISAADYHGKAKEWAESCGFIYYSANSMSEFIKNVPSFISVSDKPVIFEVFVNDIDESEAFLKLVNENKKPEIKETLKKEIKTIIGDEMFKKIKKKIKE